MKKITTSFIIGFMALAFSFVPTTASACSCIMQPESNAEALASSAAVFQGTFVSSAASTDTMAPGKTLTFDVSKTWKGPNTKTITARTADNSAACGWDPEVGKEYLIYAYAQEGEGADAGELGVNLCGRKFLIEDAGKDLAVLGEGQTPAATETPVSETPFPDAAGNDEGSDLLVRVVPILLLLAVVIVAYKMMHKKKIQ